MMKAELVNLSTAYLMGWKTIRDCAEYLASIDWDAPSIDPVTQDIVGRFELLVTEVLEGLCPEAVFWQKVAEFVANETDSLFSPPMSLPESVIAYSSNDRNSPCVEITVLAGAGG